MASLFESAERLILGRTAAEDRKEKEKEKSDIEEGAEEMIPLKASKRKRFQGLSFDGNREK